MRLAVWFALIASVLLLAFLPAVYLMIRRQMESAIDRQLQIDWNLIEAHLEADGGGGRIQWRKSSPATPQSPGYAESWFDVWRDDESLLKHWPAPDADVLRPPRPEKSDRGDFYSVHLEGDRPVRAFQKPAVVDGQTVILRVFRDESGQRAIQRRIVSTLALGIPLAVLLAALGGYAMAGRSLKAVGDMANEARQIGSESLGKRLPVSNPHDELGQLATVFNNTLERLEASFESLKRFTADASHELRTPLTALRSVGEIALRQDRDPAVLRETIGSMLEEAQRMHDLTDSLLILARVESGRLPTHPESIDSDPLIREVVERLEVLASEKNQRIDIRSEPGGKVLADRTLLQQAATNLLHNAIRYSPPDAVIRVSCQAARDQLLIEFADEGPGIALEHREKIFERFYRIDKARSRDDGGTGLGLALAKLAVEQSGGRIELEPGPAGGSIFRIVLPRDRS